MSSRGRLTHYTFRSVWEIPASSGNVYDALYDLGSYPLWWPEIKSAERVDEDRFRLRCRSFLPYDLEFVSERARADREAGILEARLIGDLEGFSRWTIETRPSSFSLCRLTFDEEVVTNKRMLNLLAPVARLPFRINHSLMMRHGRKGLQVFMGGFELAHQSRRG